MRAQRDRPFAPSTFTLVLACILIAVGVMRGAMAFQLKPAAGWFWTLLSGIVSIVLGGMILAEWPASVLWVIGLFVAIELIYKGWSYVFIALAARKAGQADAVDAVVS